MTKDGLQIDSDERFLAREYALQRIGIPILAALLLAGAAGAFGNGPLAAATVREGGTTITFERFGRATAPTRLGVRVTTTVRDGEKVRIRVDRTFLDRVEIAEVRPPDAFVALDGDAAVFEVRAAGGLGQFDVLYRPAYGVLRAVVAPDSSAPAALWQFIYF